MTKIGKAILIGGAILFVTKRQNPGGVTGSLGGIFNAIGEGARSIGKAVAPSDKGQSFIDELFGPSTGVAIAAGQANSGTPGQSMATAPTFGIAGTTDGYAEPTVFFDAKSVFGA